MLMAQLADDSPMDFVEFLPLELVLVILSYLVDPVDIIQLSMVSRAWYTFVIRKGICRSLCESRAPSILNINNFVEIDRGVLCLENRLSNNLSFHKLKKNHRMYWSLLRALFLAPQHPKDCIGHVIAASTTDDYPRESIIHTLLPLDHYGWGNSYWSSKGYKTPDVNEAILIKLSGGFCIVNEIKIRPFQDDGQNLYPPKYVRFSLGRAKSHMNFKFDVENLPLQGFDDKNYIWDYSSPKYEVEMEATLQSFTLPQPVLCVGGFLKIDLLGMTRREQFDRLYYICIGHIDVLGHSLKPAYDLEMGFLGMMSLLHTPAAVEGMIQEVTWADDYDDDHDEMPAGGGLGLVNGNGNGNIVLVDSPWKRQVEKLMILLFGHAPIFEYHDEEEEEDDVEEEEDSDEEDEDDYDDDDGGDDDSDDGGGDAHNVEVGEEEEEEEDDEDEDYYDYYMRDRL